ncbi:universal stress protein [uncultured Mycolicibacterium sp.]|uniref:universal stress protein n=1 Tax=uncultured Mycolicibacterium sp. TaxID=2320817 RepID=UPI00260F1CDE|nr:universal stress protein [uncultured Mycolicibacterium sp.]
MTVVVGYLTGKCGRAPLRLAAELARALHTGVAVVTVLPRPLVFLSPTRVDAEYADYAEHLADESADEARAGLAELTGGQPVTFHRYVARSAAAGLLQAVEELDATALVIGSTLEGRLGQVVIGSTADRLLHSAPVPLALPPRGYPGSRTGALTRISVAYPGTEEAVPVVRRAAALAQRMGLPLRVLTFAVRGPTMYPPEVGLDSEDLVLQAWAEEAQQRLAALRGSGVVDAQVPLQVVTGHDWAQAVGAAGWQDGELLALGTSPRETIARVFLGSHGTKILRHSPVPALVLPG